MKHKLIASLFAASLVLSASSVFANGTPPPAPVEPVSEGLEISGNVDVIAGYQHDDKDVPAAAGYALGGMVGDSIIGANAANADHFRFVVDQVELDLAKTFGENIRLRADLDMRDLANTTSRAAGAALDVEQAYVTANLAAGNGIELLIGKFNAPVGVESVDRNANWFISYASPYRYMTPTNVTGAKLYYAFSDLIDLHFAIVNNLNGGGFANSAMPSALFRLGFNWGEEDNKSTLGLSGGVGPELGPVTGVSHNAHWDFFGDLDAIVALSDTVTMSAEGIYRQTDNSVAASVNQKAISASLGLKYQASDVWDVDFRGAYHWEINPDTGIGASTTGTNFAGAGTEGTIYSGTVGAGYAIADGAKMKLEYRFDFLQTAGATANSDYHSLMAEFAYTF